MFKHSAAALVLAGLLVVPTAAQIIEQVLVNVNGDILTKTEFEQRQITLLRARPELSNVTPDSPELRKAVAEVTPQLILEAVDELLLIQRGRELGLVMGDEQFTNIVASIKSSNNIETDEAFLAALRERLMSVSLILHPDKTRLIEFGRFAERDRQRRGDGKPETFDFLGFTHCCSRTRQGWFFILRMTVKKRMRATLKAIRAKLRSMMHHPIPLVGKWLGSVVRGYFNYFAVPGNIYRLTSFRKEICRTWRRMLYRRSQRHRLSWERFAQLENRYIPTFRTLHPYPEQRFRVKYSRQEPCAVMPLAGICAGGRG